MAAADSQNDRIFIFPNPRVFLGRNHWPCWGSDIRIYRSPGHIIKPASLLADEEEEDEEEEVKQTFVSRSPRDGRKQEGGCVMLKLTALWPLAPWPLWFLALLPLLIRLLTRSGVRLRGRTGHWTVCIVLYAVCTVRSVYCAQCSLYAVHWTQCILYVQCTVDPQTQCSSAWGKS